MGFPIRKSPDQSLFAAPQSLSQRITSFIASDRQGIHQTPFLRLIRSRTKQAGQGGPRGRFLPSRFGRSPYDLRSKERIERRKEMSGATTGHLGQSSRQRHVMVFERRVVGCAAMTCLYALCSISVRRLRSNKVTVSSLHDVKAFSQREKAKPRGRQDTLSATGGFEPPSNRMAGQNHRKPFPAPRLSAPSRSASSWLFRRGETTCRAPSAQRRFREAKSTWWSLSGSNR